jgi:hypothetical protein
MSNQFAPYQQQPPAYSQEPQQSGSGCLWGMLLGCLGVIVVSGLVCAGLVWYVQQNIGKWGAGIAREAIVATIEASEIPEDEKKDVIAQVDRVVNEYKAGKIGEQELERLMTEYQNSPAFLLMGAWGLEKSYLEPSALSDEEKEQGRRTIQRAFRGLCEKKISQQQFQAAVPQPDFEDLDADMEAEGDAPPMPPVPPAPPPGGSRVTDDEVRQMLDNLKKLADDAGIPDEPFTIDIGDEVKKFVDQALEDKKVP